MAEIKAFVAHSFSEDDASIVQSFLRYFDQVKKLRPDFSWEHAEAAEPRELAQKVLSIIADKNVCIAICTKKERVIAPTMLSETLFPRDALKGKASDFEWKTTDWIIQEIGLALGRGLSLIILLEEGVRRPGGLQGNIEYIEFSRSDPSKASGKILEMIHALTPQPVNAGAAVADGPTQSSVDGKPPPTGDAEDWHEPKPDWTYENYWSALLGAVFLDDADRQKKLTDSYLATPDGASKEKAAEWCAELELLKIEYSKDGDFERLRKIATEHPDNGTISAKIARAYAKFGDFGKSAEQYEIASAKEPDPERRFGLKCRAATQLASGGKLAVAEEKLETLKTDALANTAFERRFLKAVIEIADIAKDTNSAIVAMERLVEIAPEDTDTRFSLAFKHSQAGNEELALAHYLKIPYEQRNHTTWNNIGVSFERMSMPGKSISAYRMAEDMDETLAMSNLGYRFMHAGFLKEAEAEFVKGLAIKDFNQNVATGYAELKNIPERENAKEAEAFHAARPKADYYQAIGRAIAQPNIASLAQRWCDPDCELAVSISGREFKAQGSYEREAGGGLAAFSIGGKVVIRYRVEYRGRISGRQIEGTVKRIREGDQSAATTLLSLGDIETKLLMTLSDDGAELKVMENPQNTTPKFYSIRRIL
jgi:tetratricopeptide (TPR) repeat protein